MNDAKLNKKCNGLRLITHVFGETLVVIGGIFVALSLSRVLDNPIYFASGFGAIIVGAFCQWNPV